MNDVSETNGAKPGNGRIAAGLHSIAVAPQCHRAVLSDALPRPARLGEQKLS